MTFSATETDLTLLERIVDYREELYGIISQLAHRTVRAEHLRMEISQLEAELERRKLAGHLA